jgi:hypothetical protein
VAALEGALAGRRQPIQRTLAFRTTETLLDYRASHRTDNPAALKKTQIQISSPSRSKSTLRTHRTIPEPIVTGMGVCKNLQAVPNQASTIGIERPRRRTADPDFPGSAAFCGSCLLPVTPEAAGSSPVDPANIH